MKLKTILRKLYILPKIKIKTRPILMNEKPKIYKWMIETGVKGKCQGVGDMWAYDVLRAQRSMRGIPSPYTYLFADDKEAVLFKMRWG